MASNVRKVGPEIGPVEYPFHEGKRDNINVINVLLIIVAVAVIGLGHLTLEFFPALIVDFVVLMVFVRGLTRKRE